MRTLELTADRGGERLDTFIARRCPELSRSHARRLIDEGLVSVNGRQGKPSERVRAGIQVTVTVPPPQAMELAPEEIPLAIIYQDSDIIVLDKPAGLTVHPAPGHPSGTLVNALLAACPDLRGIAGTLRPGIVHRLDKDTSGLMVVAKNDRAQRALQRQLKEREVHKTYVALVKGEPSPREGVIEAPIGRHPKNRKKMAVVAGGREAVTRYRVRETFDGSPRYAPPSGGATWAERVWRAEGGATRAKRVSGAAGGSREGGRYSLAEAEPVTGRTHQIRVHMAALGHPIVGDTTYGKRSELIGRQALHASKLAFAMPASGRIVEFESPLPRDIIEALSRLRSEDREADR